MVSSSTKLEVEVMFYTTLSVAQIMKMVGKLVTFVKPFKLIIGARNFVVLPPPLGRESSSRSAGKKVVETEKIRS